MRLSYIRCLQSTSSISSTRLNFARKLFSPNKGKFFGYYVTTPIFYVNSSPHIGHVYTLLIADALNRLQRLKQNNDETIFSSGTDEHGIKIQNAAELVGIEYQKFCDENAHRFNNLIHQYNITITDFVRTSHERHKSAVQAVWSDLQSEGFIYKDNYSGWYCTSEETYVPESQVIEAESNGAKIFTDKNQNIVSWSSEDNYIFKFSHFRSKILEWLVTQKPVIPDRFNEEAINMLNRMEGDISISRPRSRLKWGIEVPSDPTQTVYVWLDALTNYLTVAGYPCEQGKLSRWPIDCQVIGKDILKFHALYWPSFLLALSLPLPKKLLCHSHWLVDSSKISKSKGNVIDPGVESQFLTNEGLRYYLLRAGTPLNDTDYDRAQGFNRINSELADTYGCLLSRCCAKAINPDQSIPTGLSEVPDASIVELKNRLIDIGEICDYHFGKGDFYKGIEEIMSILRINHALYERSKPWQLVKELKSNVASQNKYNDIQTITFETLRICSILLQPIVPNLSKAILDRMNVNDRSWTNARPSLDINESSSFPRNLKQSSNEALFPRLKTTG